MVKLDFWVCEWKCEAEESEGGTEELSEGTTREGGGVKERRPEPMPVTRGLLVSPCVLGDIYVWPNTITIALTKPYCSTVNLDMEFLPFVGYIYQHQLTP